MWYVLVKPKRDDASLGDKIDSEWKDEHLHGDGDRRRGVQMGDLRRLWGLGMDIGGWVVVYGFGWWVGSVMIFFNDISMIYIISFKKRA